MLTPTPSAPSPHPSDRVTFVNRKYFTAVARGSLGAVALAAGNLRPKAR